MVSYRIHGACSPLLSSVSSDTNFPGPAPQRQTPRSAALSGKPCLATRGQAAGDRAAKRCLVSSLEMQACGPAWKPVATRECSTMANGALAIDTVQYWSSCGLTKAALIGTGDRDVLPSLPKQTHARVQSSSPEDRVYS